MSLLTFNVDLAAVLRHASRQSEPDPSQLAMLGELYGVDAISVQFRRDRKYIRERDLYLLKGVVKSKLIIEMPPLEDAIDKIIELKPHTVIFSADHADSDSPLSPIDFNSAPVDYKTITNQLQAVGIEVGYFVEPEPEEVKGAFKANASTVIVNCAGYTEARTVEDAQAELDRIDRASQTAHKYNLSLVGARGLNYKNIQPLVELQMFQSFVVGDALVSRAMLLGLKQAVDDMLRLLKK